MTDNEKKDLARLVKIVEELKQIHRKCDYGVEPEVIKMVDDWILDLHTPADKKDDEITLRDPWEIQRAHDIFGELASGRLDLGLPAHIQNTNKVIADCLCWILGHTDGGKKFEISLDLINSMARDKGFVITKVR